VPATIAAKLATAGLCPNPLFLLPAIALFQTLPKNVQISAPQDTADALLRTRHAYKPTLMQELRHITSINDLTSMRSRAVFSLAQTYLRELSDPLRRIGSVAASPNAQGTILASSVLRAVNANPAFLRKRHAAAGLANPSAAPIRRPSSAPRARAWPIPCGLRRTTPTSLVIRHRATAP
jgi:hypothetical protein